MFSIGRLAKLANVSTRAVRHYEACGLLSSSQRAENNYRQFDPSQLEKLKRIRGLQGLGFSLKEVHNILAVEPKEFRASLEKKLAEIDGEAALLRARKSEIERLLSISNKIDLQTKIDDIERMQYMSAIKTELIEGLKSRNVSKPSATQLDYVERDDRFYSDPARAEMLGAIKKCADFAKRRGLTLGPGRGSSPASIALFALGFGSIDPSRYDLIPERLTMPAKMDIHIDVEFARGQEFVDFCREISSQLSYGEINAFKMPLIDIIQNVHERIGVEVPYGAIDENSETVLAHFRSGEIDKIFGFDLSPRALIMKYENLLPDYLGTQRMSEYLVAQPIRDFRDVVNISALWRPHREELVARLERYKQAKINPHEYGFLSPHLRDSLMPNFGLIIYHEDCLRLLHHYSGWDLGRCNRVRRGLAQTPDAPETIKELANLCASVPAEVYELFVVESPWAFCQPHAVAFSVFTKKTAVLKSLHRETYLNEIDTWEQKHGFTWDDIGVKLKGVSILQN